MKDSKGIGPIMEIFWLTVAASTLFIGVYEWVQKSFTEVYTFFILSIVSVFLYLFRRSIRIKSNKKNKKQ